MAAYYQVIVERLRQAYWPVWLAKLAEDPRINQVLPIDFVPETDRISVPNYDVRRIRTFLDEIREGKTLAPIDIENESSQYRITSPIRWGGPLIVDGHHRFVAAHLAGKEHIPATFGGLETTINWLTGKRKRIPEELTA